ncbi:dTDP-4-dehydrorhamnose 3,5-epimerase family protein [Treponema primitia]|uniref:dTDP-4-dehydrorhamnose 3,5-epimerase family protein n=1 Tax=Treponema primitia TaxID=88058 RepID=UPI0039808F57
MNFVSTSIEGQFQGISPVVADERGSFQKFFNFNIFKEHGLQGDFKELYYSVSHKDVIRGMHFQIPPYEHAKLVYVSCGSILDVTVDLRQNSPSFKHVFSTTLCAASGDFLYIPAGVAHGFYALTEESIVHYAQTSCYNKECDKGVLYSSIGFDWHIEHPIVSERDNKFPTMQNFLGEKSYANK